MSYRLVLLSKKKSETFNDNHESEDEDLVEENGQGVSTVHQAVAFRQQYA